MVAPREGRVSRNYNDGLSLYRNQVAPREGRVSRNNIVHVFRFADLGRAPRGACE